MRRYRVVIEYTQTHVKNITKITNFENNDELDSIMVNKGRIHEELREYLRISLKFDQI